MEFGLFDWIDRGTGPLHQLYEERLQLLEAAEEAGFFCYHLAEHHATPLGMAPSPALFLAAAAQRTRRIRLGPLVYLLPLYNPLRLIEEVCMLDQISNGRLELGVGRGVSPYELRYFNVDPAATREIFKETLQVLIDGMTKSRLTFEGRHYRYSDVPMELRPLQQPYPPLWYPTHNPDSVRYAARHGFNFVGLGPAAAVRAHVTCIGEHGSCTGAILADLTVMSRRPRLASCAKSSSQKPMRKLSRSLALPTRTGIVRSPSCGTTMTTTALMGCSLGRQPRSTRL